MSDRTQIIFGPPGTGKTHTLINIVEEHLSQGTAPNKIGYVSFTRRAAYEARDRAAQKFGYSAEELPWFSTLHSIAFRQLNLLPIQVMQPQDWVDLGQLLGPYDFANAPGSDFERVMTVGAGLGDKCLFIYSYARSKMISIEDAWHQIAIRNRAVSDIPLSVVERFVKGLNQFKEAREMFDFTDMLNLESPDVDLDVLIVDEAQDLTMQQWTFVKRLAKSAHHVYVAGDDDQAIYDWTGGDSSVMFRIPGDRRVLPHSHRLPRRLVELAQRWSNRIAKRQPKEWDGRDEEGEVNWVPELDDVDLSQGSWLMLSRTRHLMQRLERQCRQQGVVYELNGQWSNQHSSVRAARAYETLRRGKRIPATLARPALKYAQVKMTVRPGEEISWEDVPWGFEGRPPWFEVLNMGLEQREYIRGLLRRGENLTEPGRVRISTIHGAKGGEAENVVLLPDTTKRLVHINDDELRVWYVGITRASQRLFLVQPKKSIYFPLDV